MGWWIALGVIFLLGILPLGISARYSGEGPLLRVVIGPVRLTLFPRKRRRKSRNPRKKRRNSRKTGRTSPKAAPAPQAGACGG